MALGTLADNTLNTPTRSTNNYAYLGHIIDSTGLDVSVYFLGHLAEHWVLVKDVSAALIISSRLNSLYKTALA